MSVKEELEKKLEAIETCLDKATEVLSGYGDVDDGILGGVEAQIQLLGDQLHQRLQTLPKNAKEVRISRLDVATLARILERWAQDMGSAVQEIEELQKIASKEAETLAEQTREIESLKTTFLEELEELEGADENPSIPELGLSSELRSLEIGL